MAGHQFRGQFPRIQLKKMSFAAKEIDLTSAHSIRVGDFSRVRFAIKYNDLPLNLIGASAECTIKRYWDSPPTLTVDIEFVDRVAGIIDLIITEAQSALFQPLTYRYSIKFILGNNQAYTPVYGKIEFTA